MKRNYIFTWHLLFLEMRRQFCEMHRYCPLREEPVFAARCGGAAALALDSTADDFWGARLDRVIFELREAEEEW